MADVLVGAVQSAIMLGALAASPEARPLDAMAIMTVIVLGGWTAAARHAPRVALVGAAASLSVAFAVGVAAFTPALALGVPLLVVGLTGHLGWGVGVIVLFGVTGVPVRILAEAEPVGRVAIGSLYDLGLLALILLVGETLRSRAALREQAALRLRLAEEEHQRRTTTERLQTARDLHDVLAHTVTIVGIQAGVATESLEDDPQRAREALEVAGAANRDALADLRSTIAVLRADGAASTRPTPGIEALPELLEGVRGTGVETSLRVRGEAVPLRPAVALVIYRIVQESLTNALRHGHAGSVAVELDYTDDAVRVEVRDDGIGAAPDTGTGSGLRGMTERVAALGGELSARPAGRSGFVVRARLPGAAR